MLHLDACRVHAKRLRGKNTGASASHALHLFCTMSFLHVESSWGCVRRNDCNAFLSCLSLNAGFGHDILIGTGQAAKEVDNLKQSLSLRQHNGARAKCIASHPSSKFFALPSAHYRLIRSSHTGTF